MVRNSFGRTILAVALACTACSAQDPNLVPLPETQNSDLVPDMHRAVVQVRQTLNLTPDETLRLAVDSLHRRQLGISDLSEVTGQIETDWLPVTDSNCLGHSASNAPLECRMRLSFKVEALPQTASVLNVRYQELCSFNEEIHLECPGSTAEKLMLSIVGEIKDQDAKLYPPSRWQKIFN
ncbi:MAG: hypothetical protein U0136_10280 [Bdellovibrionota bacterium]